MPNFTVKIKANPSFQRLGKTLSDPGVREALSEIITKFSFLTESYAKQVTPVDTGRLRASIGTSFLQKAGIKAAKVSTNTEYAVYVHEGTAHMKARPFMMHGVRFAEQNMNSEIPRRLDDKIRQRLSRL